MNELFLSSRAVYIICFDLSKDLHELAGINYENQLHVFILIFFNK